MIPFIFYNDLISFEKYVYLCTVIMRCKIIKSKEVIFYYYFFLSYSEGQNHLHLYISFETIPCNERHKKNNDKYILARSLYTKLLLCDNKRH